MREERVEFSNRISDKLKSVIELILISILLRNAAFDQFVLYI